MLNVSRYIIIQAIVKDDKTLVPLWDDSIIYENEEEYGELIKLKGDNYRTYYPIECLFDIKNKTLSIGIEIDQYPEKLDYQKGERVYFETGKHRYLKEGTITDIIYEEFDLACFKGSDANNWYLNKIKDLDPNKIYAFKNWKPFYIMDDGTKITYDYKIYKISKS